MTMKHTRILMICIALIIYMCNTSKAQTPSETNTVQKSENKVIDKLKENVKIGGWIDFQYLFENNGTSKSNAFQIRRARFDVKGSLSPKIDFRLQTDMSPSPKLIDAFVKVKFCKYVQLQAGQFKIPFSLENILSPLDLETMDNAQVISALSGYKDVTGISSYANGREIGLMLSGTLASADVKGENIPILQYEAGVFGGNGINVKTDNMAKDFSARIKFCPFVNHLVLSASAYIGRYDMQYQNVSIKTDGDRIRYAGGLQYSDDNLLVRSEYLYGKTDLAALTDVENVYTHNTVKTQGVYIVAGYWFKFNWNDKNSTPQKIRPVLRAEFYESDISKGTPAEYYSVGVDWWPEKHLRFQIDYVIRNQKQTPIKHVLATMLSVKF